MGARFLKQVPALRKGINLMAKGMAKTVYGTKAWPVFEVAANSIGLAGKLAFGENYRAGMIREEVHGGSKSIPVTIFPAFDDRTSSKINKSGPEINPQVTGEKIPKNSLSAQVINIPDFDERTKSLIDKFGPKADLYITGLINLKTMEMHLRENCAHLDLAMEKHLFINRDHLKDNWYGFNLTYDSSQIRVSPRSGRFGGIPIEFSSVFENYICKLYGSKAKEAQILFYQFKYNRKIPNENVLNSYFKKNDLVPRSLSDEELPKERI